MKYYLTSNPIDEERKILNTKNGFVESLRANLPNKSKLLFICSNPYTYEITDQFGNEIKSCFIRSDFCIEQFTILDDRNRRSAETLVQDADCVFLAGGHVPTQNRFFAEIKLSDILRKYTDKVIIGFSAGSMNCAAEVYAQPEEEGEAVSPSYQRFLKGLGISKTMILPHYQAIKDGVLDGKRIFPEITYPDSMGRCFYAINDGSYIYGDGKQELLLGEGYLIQDGTLSRITKDGESYRIL